MKAKVNLVGKTFNCLTVINQRRDPNGKGYIWVCECECGNIVYLTSQKLICGSNKSCGCKKKELIGDKIRRHGGKGTSEFNIWCSMKARCTNPKSQRYEYYGGRGIKVCDRWLNSFELFLLDMGIRPSNRHSIERINNDADYSPQNCIWATKKEQAINRRKRRTKIAID